MKGKLSQRIIIGPAKEALAVNLLGFELAGFAVEVLNGLHFRIMAAF
jgi:hypothetical protein